MTSSRTKNMYFYRVYGMPDEILFSLKTCNFFQEKTKKKVPIIEKSQQIFRRWDFKFCNVYGLLKNGTFIIKNKILVHSASLRDISLTKMGDFQIPVMGKRQPNFFFKQLHVSIFYVCTTFLFKRKFSKSKILKFSAKFYKIFTTRKIKFYMFGILVTS